MKYLIIIFIFSLALVSIAIAKTPKSNSKLAENYLNQLNQFSDSHQVNEIEKKFLSVFGDLKRGGQENIVRELYAENLYFNDTFKVLYNIDDVVEHLVSTAKQVETTTVEILDVAKSGSDYYVRWVMVMEFKVKRKSVYSKSIGMSQLRFNEDGKIVFHQDFWDSTEGFFQHLPYIGYFVRKVRSKL